MKPPNLQRTDGILEPGIYATGFNTKERNHELMGISYEDLHTQKLSRAFLMSGVGGEVSLVMMLSVPNGTYIDTVTLRNVLPGSMPAIFLDASNFSTEQANSYIASNSAPIRGRDDQTGTRYSLLPSIDWAHEENLEECFKKIRFLLMQSHLLIGVNESTAGLETLFKGDYNRTMLEHICSSGFYAATGGELKTQGLIEQHRQHVSEVLGSK